MKLARITTPLGTTDDPACLQIDRLLGQDTRQPELPNKLARYHRVEQGGNE